MKVNKFCSKALVLSILFSSISNISMASSWSDDGRYETFEGNDIKINNVLEEDNIDLNIEGSSLVNYFNYDSLYGYIENVKVNKNDKTILFKAEPNSDVCVFYDVLLDSKKTYTISFDVIDSTISSGWFCYLDTNPQYSSESWGVITPGDKVQTVKKSFNLKDTENGTYKMYLRSTESEDNSFIKIKNVMILEGDWTNKDMPDYFEGMKSSGELEDNNIRIVSDSDSMVDLSPDNWETGSIHGGDGSFNDNRDRIRTKKFYELPRGNELFIRQRGLYKLAIRFYDENFNIIDGESTPYQGFIKVKKMNIPQGAKYYKLVCANSFNENTPISPSDIVNFTGIIFVPNIEKQLKLNQPLRGTPTGIKDKIIKKDGKWAIERNYKEVILDGSENWDIHPDVESWFFTDDFKDMGVGTHLEKSLLLSDKFTVHTYMDVLDIPNMNIAAGNPSSNIKRLILKNKSCSTVEEWSRWLSNNPTKVIYKLQSPIYEPLNDEYCINITQGTSYILSDLNIPVNMKITVDRVANKAAEAIELAKASPTVENLAQARMWINLLKESTLKDDFQDEVSDITNITGMQLEKKKVSANIDLYVKSENSLSMSLSTNSITFDNYTGTEDMEKLKAVEISINSSLPYDLNAYLETNFSNSDGSKNMDINTLKIKESSKSNYSSFTNLKEKVTLKEDCASGNYIKHDIDLKLESDNAHQADVYKTTVKFEAIQK